jgi:ribosomal protein L33
MHSLADHEVLTCWEEGLDENPVRRMLRLLAAAMPEVPDPDLAAMSIGERDGHLFSLRRMMFGEQLDCVSFCPSCNERVEFSCRVSDLAGAWPGPDVQKMTLNKDGYMVAFRLPSSADLLEIPADDPDTARAELFRRCIRSIDGPKNDISPEQLPPAIRDEIISRMEEIDPLSEVRISLRCTACGHAWEETFDISSFFWNEIIVHAAGILQDVHELARVYGWAEHDILAMSPVRRLRYREMINI